MAGKEQDVQSLFLTFLLINATLARQPLHQNLPTTPQTPDPAPAKNWSTLSG
ncbi:putative glycerophosphodiester phosphodiesterase GDPDL7-like, partial [Sesbania bispinosa]